MTVEAWVCARYAPHPTITATGFPCVHCGQAEARHQRREEDPRSDWIQTHSIRKYYPLEPNPEQVSIADIGHALSMICRFTGHVHTFYSVAEHSVRVSMEVSAEKMTVDLEAGYRLMLERWGLLHDADEAYLVDVARPVKKTDEMAPYRAAAERNLNAILQRFRLPLEEPPPVKVVDNRLCYTEARDLFPRVHPDWRWDAAPLPEKLRPRVLWLFAPLLTAGLRLALWAGKRRAAAALLRARLRCGPMSPVAARAAFQARFLELFPGEEWR